MAGKHDVRNKFVSFALPRTLIERITIAAAGAGMSRSAYAKEIFEKQTDGVVLPVATKQKIMEEIRNEIAARRAIDVQNLRIGFKGEDLFITDTRTNQEWDGCCS